MTAGCLQKLSVKPQKHYSLVHHPVQLTRRLQPAGTALTLQSKHHHASVSSSANAYRARLLINTAAKRINLQSHEPWQVANCAVADVNPMAVIVAGRRSRQN